MRASELQQMVLNLGINARDAMPDGGMLEIRFERCELVGKQARALGVSDGSYARLTCRDTGIGMDEATLARVFEPFFTTKGHGRGTGLGLTNVWNIARLAGGCVEAESKVGAGTTFRVYLPLSDELPTDVPHRPSGEIVRGHETVLVVEDDIRIRALLVTTLGDAGYNVLDAQSVDAALAIERDFVGEIDLVCTDVVMPGRPARELIAELRKRRPHASVLVCSGYSHDELIARGVQSGELTLLAKPFTRKALLASVRLLLVRA
jgi:CheY-like chemotaxis protein